MLKNVAVIIPTTGSEQFKQCYESVFDQTYDYVRPYVVVDGYEFHNKTINSLENFHPDYFTFLQENVGANGWYGHRIYAAFSFLVNRDYVMFLDQDNWLEPDHVRSMVAKLEDGNFDWVYSLRNIHDQDGSFVCKDNCESLGMWKAWTSQFSDKDVHHIDTSCFLIRREVLVNVAHAWYGQWGADRQFFQVLSRHYPNFGCTGRHTVNYRLGGNQGSVTKEFFLRGNKYMQDFYGTTDFPWISPVE